MKKVRWLKTFRVASLVAAPLLAWASAYNASGIGRLYNAGPPPVDPLAEVVVFVLGPLWVAMCFGLLLRAAARSRANVDELSALDRLDVLTATGSGTLWVSALAIAAALRVGWASLAVTGIAGLAALALVLVWTLLAAGSDDPMRVASVRRCFGVSRDAAQAGAAETTEGEAVVEVVHLTGARIPAGFRLFATGCVGPRWPVSRYAVDASASGGEVVLESDLGPGHRGQHDAPAMDLWLGDVLGLCKSVRRHAGAATLTVMPRLRSVDGARGVLGQGGQDQDTQTATKLPTEGSMRLKEYQPGDDARRIHWMRSLAAREVVVRLPDELPRDRPKLRLVLDTFLPDSEELTCTAHHELLDGLVKVWLGAARAFADDGAQVTLVTATPRGEGVVPRRLPLSPRALAPALRVGAEVSWQDDLGIEDLVTDTKERTIVVSHRLAPASAPAGVGWIVVPRSLWTHLEDPAVVTTLTTLPYPLGSADNRWSHRRRERQRVREAKKSSAALVELAPDPPLGTRAVVARPIARDRIVLEALS